MAIVDPEQQHEWHLIALPGRTARLPAQAAKLAANRVAGVGVDPLRGAARGRRYLSAPAASVGGLLSKSVTLPAALLMWHWWKRVA